MDGQMTRHSFVCLETVKEPKKLVSGSEAAVLARVRFGFGKCLFLHRKCCFEIDLSCFHGFVPQPQSNDGHQLPRTSGVRAACATVVAQTSGIAERYHDRN